VNNGIPQVLSGGLAFLVLHSDLMGGAIMINHRCMADRDIRRALLKVAHGVAASQHELIHELIGFRHGTFGIIDEARLDHPPFMGKTLTLLRRQFAKAKFLDALFAGQQNVIRAMGANFPHGSFIFRTELLLQLCLAPPPNHHHRDDQKGHGDQYNCDDQPDFGIHGHLLVERDASAWERCCTGDTH